MGQLNESEHDSSEESEEDLELLVDTLRRCFGAEKARYHVMGEENALLVEIEGLEALDEEMISEVAAPVLEELDMDFDEISLLPLN